ncbi:unnamed protein product [Adineta ricciae]|uniref:Uncharacterized protein n=1 Tax=Adineta ricciae TaxID=249248 RepID=A0A813N2L5_ADIRI|nr:unnamed protein product [Adineta ricciae]CAF1448078.1 unnamed protein product [Adineta ricciae]
MIVQSAPLILKQRNQPSRECLYAWYPEVVPDTGITTTMAPRDIYINKGLDKDLLQQDTITASCNNSNNNNNVNDVLQRYKQSIASSERAYHSAGTIDEALRTPWALHYEIERRPATPNLPSTSTDMPIHEEVPRRLKSAPLIRTLPSTSVLTVPEPRFMTPLVSAPTHQPAPTQPLPPSATANKPRVRASSARGRLNTSVTFNEEQLNYHNRQEQRRESRSAQRTPQYKETQVANEINPIVRTQVYTEATPPHQQQQQQSSVIVPSTTTPSVYVYQRSATWCGNDQPACCTKVETSVPVVLNPYYIRRPGVVSATNAAKKTVVQDYTTTRKPSKHRRRVHHPHHQHHQQHSRHQKEKRNEPMLATAPLSYSTKVPVEIDGVKLLYDPTLSLDDPSSNLKKYLIEGRLYLIKDQCYNVVENVDAYNRTQTPTPTPTHTLPPRPKYYKTIPIEKLQIPKPAPDVHYNASETFFYNTIPKRVHRYVIDPNFISENLNVNKMPLSQRPPTANATHSTISDVNRQATVYA